jgi:hypothetical protein
VDFETCRVDAVRRIAWVDNSPPRFNLDDRSCAEKEGAKEGKGEDEEEGEEEEEEGEEEEEERRRG